MFVVRIPRVGCRVGREGDNWQGHAGRGRGRGGGGGGWGGVGIGGDPIQSVTAHCFANIVL